MTPCRKSVMFKILTRQKKLMLKVKGFFTNFEYKFCMQKVQTFNSSSLQVSDYKTLLLLEWVNHVLSSPPTTISGTTPLATHESKESTPKNVGEDIVHPWSTPTSFPQTLFSIAVIKFLLFGVGQHLIGKTDFFKLRLGGEKNKNVSRCYFNCQNNAATQPMNSRFTVWRPQHCHHITFNYYLELLDVRLYFIKNWIYLSSHLTRLMQRVMTTIRCFRPVISTN